MSDKVEDSYNDNMSLVEEYLNVDSSIIEMEKNGDLIRMEMNIVEFPIFSRSNNLKVNQIKKYYFSNDKESYLEVVPRHGGMIPGELEERIFIALTKILRNNGFKATFYCTMNDIFDNMKIENINTRRTLYPKVKSGLDRLASTNFRFKNLFYSSELGRPIDDFINTNILTYRAIKFKDANNKEQSFFADKRLKEIYAITFSKQFHDNVIKKGYLTFDADLLLKIKDPVTRSIFTMITKWRYKSLYLKKQAYFIARRIPLAWDKNPRRTVLRIEKSLQSLKDDFYIKDFRTNKNKKWEQADFEIFFDESHNDINQQNFYEEKAYADKLIHMIEERQNDALDISSSDIFGDPEFLKIYNTFPEEAKKLKTLVTVIREALKKHDYKYVLYTAEYTAYNCKASFIKYFKEALINNWAEAYIIKKESFEEKRLKKQEKIIEEAILVEEVKNELPKSTWDEFLSLEPTIQEKIVTVAYESFLSEAGSKDNKTMKGIFDKSKKPLILKIMDTYNFEKPINKLDTLDVKIENKKIVKNVVEESVVQNIQYDSISHFLVAVTKYVKENSIPLDLVDVIPVFKLLFEYEDKNIKISFNDATKIGEIIKK